ncbi:MAG: phosphoenolpyruvate synthase [Chloroflexi bacterium]|nr:phosphoenolpyruvate synthase [Chloroflexota bacterium]
MTHTDSSLLLPLDAPQATLATWGGKGLNLSRLIRAGFPVPPGFLLTTAAYRSFVIANGLQRIIDAAIAGVAADDPAALQQASTTIREAFGRGTMPAALVKTVTDTYAGRQQAAVAVRSSATAEDLPDLSFAGQQDTFLNVVGTEALLTAIVQCWSSLWTARAIGYRLRNHIPHHGLGLAVIVQEMVASEVSGVLFTANPLTGQRNQMVIDATLGLGEALVSGLVEPDQYVIDGETMQIVEKKLGAKATRIDAVANGGVRTVQQDHSQQQALSDTEILQLAAWGQDVAQHYDNQPQDIEWAYADNSFTILQARPITSLYPLPTDLPPRPLRVLASLGAVQGMQDPFTPSGQDALCHFLVSVSNTVGAGLDMNSQNFLLIAGERIFIDVTGMLRHRLGRSLLQRVLGAVEPSIGAVMQPLLADPELAVQQQRPRPATVWRLLRRFIPIVARFALSMIMPERSRRQGQRMIAQAIVQVQEQMAKPAELHVHLQSIAHLYDEIPAHVLPRLLPRLACGMASLNGLLFLSRQATGSDQLALEITRGLPHNVTTEMDLALWRTAQILRAAPELEVHWRNDAGALSRLYIERKLSPAVLQTLDDFLNTYGVRGLAEIDMGRPRWRQDPTPVFQALQSYLSIDDPEQAPDAVFARGAARAEAAIAELATAAATLPRGWIKARLVRFLARRVRALAGLRETPKWTIINIFSAVRVLLLHDGAALVTAGILNAADDIFFLHLCELQELAAGKHEGWQTLVAERRAVYAREMGRGRVPRVLLSDGRTFYEGLGATPDATGAIHGNPVSPGVAEGRVRVVLDPHHADLQPGEILVCPGTDPSWTPLFLAAAGLVMEVGGLMTHGSVVAREYGIPAVVGVHQATKRLTTGQRIRLDGATGEIRILETVS